MIPLGIVGPVLAVAASIWAPAIGQAPDRLTPVYLAGVLGVSHVLSTVVAGRINWTIAPWSTDAPEDEQALADVFNRFERAQAVRAILQLLTFVVALWAVVANAGRLAG